MTRVRQPQPYHGLEYKTVAPDRSAVTFALRMSTRYRRELLAIFLAAVAVRCVAFAVMGWKAGTVTGFAALSDGSAYIDNAKRINGDGMPSAYDQRVFVGLPWVIAMTHKLGVPYLPAAAGIGLIVPGLMCVLAARVLHDRRIGWAMAVLPPHWVLDTAAVMNESLMLTLCFAGMLVVRKAASDPLSRYSGGGLGRGSADLANTSTFDSNSTNKKTPSPTLPRRTGRGSKSPLSLRAAYGPVLAALAFALAGVVRPMTCFAVAGAIAFLLQAKRPGKAVMLAIDTLVLLALLFLAFKGFYWNPLDNARTYDTQSLAYNGQVFTYPFGSFVDAFIHRGPLNKSLIYKTLHMLAAIGVFVIAFVKWKHHRRPLDAWAVTWWGTNLAFAACIGSHWGVDIAQRSVMWAAPAAYWTMRDYLPTRWSTRLAWAVLAVPWVFVTSQT